MLQFLVTPSTIGAIKITHIMCQYRLVLLMCCAQPDNTFCCLPDCTQAPENHPNQERFLSHVDNYQQNSMSVSVLIVCCV